MSIRILVSVLVLSASATASASAPCSGAVLLDAHGNAIGEATVLADGVVQASSCRDRSSDERIAFVMFGGEAYKTASGEIVLVPKR